MSPRKKQRKKTPPHPYSRWFLVSGVTLIGIGLLLLILTFLPVITVELHYDAAQLDPKQENTVQKPVNPQFGIVIPKIGANAAIVPNVDPYNSRVYQQALTKGVAHAKGSVFPGRVGNMFLFSHSSVNFYEAMRFNSVFYLLNKLQSGDQIDIYFETKKFTYTVFESKLVNPNDVSYLMEKTNDSLLTLMTCWPPGTTFKRLIVRAKLLTN
jgi:sortase A